MMVQREEWEVTVADAVALEEVAVDVVIVVAAVVVAVAGEDQEVVEDVEVSGDKH